MITEYKLIGLNRPSSLTLQLPNGSSFNAAYKYPQSLWDYVTNHWVDVNLKAIIECDIVVEDGTPINPHVISIQAI